MWMAGAAAAKRGITVGENDEFGFAPTADQDSRPRFAGHDSPFIGAGTQEIDLQIPGTRFPA